MYILCRVCYNYTRDYTYFKYTDVYTPQYMYMYCMSNCALYSKIYLSCPMMCLSTVCVNVFGVMECGEV